MKNYNIRQIIEVVLFHTVEADSKKNAIEQVDEYDIDEAILYSDDYHDVEKTAEIQDA